MMVWFDGDKQCDICVKMAWDRLLEICDGEDSGVTDAEFQFSSLGLLFSRNWSWSTGCDLGEVLWA
jgi:hypothetical protein